MFSYDPIVFYFLIIFVPVNFSGISGILLYCNMYSKKIKIDHCITTLKQISSLERGKVFGHNAEENCACTF